MKPPPVLNTYHLHEQACGVIIGSLLWILAEGTFQLQAAEAEPPQRPPPFKTARYDEDYRYLSDPARRSDFLDRVKYIGLDKSENWFASFGGEIREKYEYYENSNWGLGPQDANGYLLQRFLLSGDLHYQDSFRVFGQFMSALEDGRTGGPRPTDEDVFDLHQGFFDVKLDLEAKGTVTARGGRQEMYFGSQRLVSVRESPNTRLSFDGARFIYQREGLRLDAFATKPVEIKTDAFDNESSRDTTFWGIYGVAPLPFLPGGNVDLYYLGVENDEQTFQQSTARELRHSVGTRLWGGKAAWDYNFEFVYQFGSFGSADISAWTAASEVGYTFAKAPLRPRLFLKADVASGDGNPNDSKVGTFNPLFPKGAYFSETGLLGPANIIDVHPGLELELTERLSFTGDWDFFWRESTSDGIYNNALGLTRAGNTTTERYIGSQAQAKLEWRISRRFTATAVYAHFFAGDFLKDSPPAEDVDYVSIWMTFRF
jgi:hypothetical protein